MFLPSVTDMMRAGFGGRSSGYHDSIEALSRLLRVARLENTSRICVVGSSGNLKYRGHGGAIDTHSLIIRINDAPVVGYETDVGSRTDVRVGWAKGFHTAMRLGLVHAGEILVARGARSRWSNSDDRLSNDLFEIEDAWVRECIVLSRALALVCTVHVVRTGPNWCAHRSMSYIRSCSSGRPMSQAQASMPSRWPLLWLSTLERHPSASSASAHACAPNIPLAVEHEYLAGLEPEMNISQASNPRASERPELTPPAGGY